MDIVHDGSPKKLNTVPPGDVYVYAFALPAAAAKVIIANFILEEKSVLT